MEIPYRIFQTWPLIRTCLVGVSFCGDGVHGDGEECDDCLCDVDASGGAAKAGDALRTLNTAVGLPVVLVCPVCP